MDARYNGKRPKGAPTPYLSTDEARKVAAADVEVDSGVRTSPLNAYKPECGEPTRKARRRNKTTSAIGGYQEFPLHIYRRGKAFGLFNTIETSRKFDRSKLPIARATQKQKTGKKLTIIWIQ